MKGRRESVLVGQSFQNQIIEDRDEQVEGGSSSPAQVTRERLMSQVRLSGQSCVEMNVHRAVFDSYVADERNDDSVGIDSEDVTSTQRVDTGQFCRFNDTNTCDLRGFGFRIMQCADEGDGDFFSTLEVKDEMTDTFRFDNVHRVVPTGLYCNVI